MADEIPDLSDGMLMQRWRELALEEERCREADDFAGSAKAGRLLPAVVAEMRRRGLLPYHLV